MKTVGHHRDKDTRASYYIYENDLLTHERVEYDLSKAINDFKKLDIFDDLERKNMFIEFLKNAYHEVLLKKDLQQMRINDNVEGVPKL